MMKRLLKAKHWQLFLLTFGIPMLFQFVMLGTIIFQISTNSTPGPESFFTIVKVFPFLMLLFVGIMMGWFWAVAIELGKKIPENVSLKTSKFKVFFTFPLVYVFIFLTFFLTIIEGAASNTAPEFWIFAIIFPLHFFCMFCMFYCLYFVAKTFKTVELQRKVTFADFAGEFFLIWFYPIGIWIIQPKINRMIES